MELLINICLIIGILAGLIGTYILVIGIDVYQMKRKYRKFTKYDKNKFNGVDLKLKINDNPATPDISVKNNKNYTKYIKGIRNWSINKLIMFK